MGRSYPKKLKCIRMRQVADAKEIGFIVFCDYNDLTEEYFHREPTCEKLMKQYTRFKELVTVFQSYAAREYVLRCRGPTVPEHNWMKHLARTVCCRLPQYTFLRIVPSAVQYQFYRVLLSAIVNIKRVQHYQEGLYARCSCAVIRYLNLRKRYSCFSSDGSLKSVIRMATEAGATDEEIAFLKHPVHLAAEHTLHECFVCGKLEKKPRAIKAVGPKKSDTPTAATDSKEPKKGTTKSQTSILDYFARIPGAGQTTMLTANHTESQGQNIDPNVEDAQNCTQDKNSLSEIPRDCKSESGAADLKIDKNDDAADDDDDNWSFCSDDVSSCRSKQRKARKICLSKKLRRGRSRFSRSSQYRQWKINMREKFCVRRFFLSKLARLKSAASEATPSKVSQECSVVAKASANQHSAGAPQKADTPFPPKIPPAQNGYEPGPTPHRFLTCGWCKHLRLRLRFVVCSKQCMERFWPYHKIYHAITAPPQDEDMGTSAYIRALCNFTMEFGGDKLEEEMENCRAHLH